MSYLDATYNRPDYSLTWEDPEVLLKSIEIQSGDRILTTAGAGESLFSFLTTEASEVVALITNPVEGYVVELKMAAIEAFSHDDCLEFLGFEDCTVRLLMYQHLEDKISPEAKEYWGEHLSFIDQGIIHCGHFEHYLHLFNSRVLPIIHSSKTTLQLFESKSAEDQQAFYATVWKSRLWKLFFTLYFSKTSFGKHPHFEEFSALNKRNFSSEIYQLTENHLCSVLAQNNEFLRYMLTGSFGNKLPFYIREENYDRVKKNLSRLKLVSSEVTDYLTTDNDFSIIHLGESIEPMEVEEFGHFATKLNVLLKSGTTVTHWNILSNHSFAHHNSNAFSANNELAQQIMKQDKCFFHTRFNIEKITK